VHKPLGKLPVVHEPEPVPDDPATKMVIVVGDVHERRPAASAAVYRTWIVESSTYTVGVLRMSDKELQTRAERELDAVVDAPAPPMVTVDVTKKPDKS
jgi:hypothetical protein